MTNGIGYTVVNGAEYALMAQPNERQVDSRRWPLTDDGERQAQAAARETAAERKVAYIGMES